MGWLDDLIASVTHLCLYDGNDTRAIFLTPPMYEAIVSSRVLPEREIPRPIEFR